MWLPLGQAWSLDYRSVIKVLKNSIFYSGATIALTFMAALIIAKVRRREISRAAAAGTVFVEVEVVTGRKELTRSCVIYNPSSMKTTLNITYHS